MPSRTLSLAERHRLTVFIARELGDNYGDALEDEEDERRHFYIAASVTEVVDGFLAQVDLSAQAPGGAFE